MCQHHDRKAPTEEVAPSGTCHIIASRYAGLRITSTGFGILALGLRLANVVIS